MPDRNRDDAGDAAWDAMPPLPTPSAARLREIFEGFARGSEIDRPPERIQEG